MVCFKNRGVASECLSLICLLESQTSDKDLRVGSERDPKNREPDRAENQPQGVLWSRLLVLAPEADFSWKPLRTPVKLSTRFHPPLIKGPPWGVTPLHMWEDAAPRCSGSFLRHTKGISCLRPWKALEKSVTET